MDGWWLICWEFGVLWSIELHSFRSSGFATRAASLVTDLLTHDGWWLIRWEFGIPLSTEFHRSRSAELATRVTGLFTRLIVLIIWFSSCPRITIQLYQRIPHSFDLKSRSNLNKSTWGAPAYNAKIIDIFSFDVVLIANCCAQLTVHDCWCWKVAEREQANPKGPCCNRGKLFIDILRYSVIYTAREDSSLQQSTRKRSENASEQTRVPIAICTMRLISIAC